MTKGNYQKRPKYTNAAQYKVNQPLPPGAFQLGDDFYIITDDEQTIKIKDGDWISETHIKNRYVKMSDEIFHAIYTVTWS